MNRYGCCVECGMISTYNATEPPAAPRNLFQVIGKRIRLEGFIVRDHTDSQDEFIAEMASLIAAGKVVWEESVAEGLEQAGLPQECVQIVTTRDRAAVGHILQGLDGSIDLLIPRGGRSLVERVQTEARVAVLGHLEGVNHVYVDASADPDMARDVVLNAKMRRVSVCGAAETLLVDRAAAGKLLPGIADALKAAGCELRADPEARKIIPDATEATDADWPTEYLAAIMAVKLVDGVGGALEHIARYGSGHTEAIVASDEGVVEQFLSQADAGIVLANASTQYTDGGEFGFGGEIGISTDRLHARGPVGAEGRTLESDAVRIDAVRRQYRDAVSRRLGLRLIRMNATTAVLIGAVVKGRNI